MASAAKHIATATTLYPHKLDLAQRALLFVRMEPGEYREASFLDDRIIDSRTQGAWIAVSQVQGALAGLPMQRPVHFIFHAGHVGSTLLSRLLDESAEAFGLREPLPLRTLAEAHDMLDMPYSLLSRGGFDELAGIMMRLWSRAPAGCGAAVVKATSSTARLGRYLLSTHAQSRALHVNLRAEPYLAAILAGANSPVDLRGQASERMRRLISMIGPVRGPLCDLTLGEIAAMTWLCERLTQLDLLAAEPERAIGVDFEELLQDMPSGLARIAAHFGMASDTQAIARLTSSPLHRKYSKATAQAFSVRDRAEILASSRQSNRTEILRGMSWIEDACRSSPRAALALR